MAAHLHLVRSHIQLVYLARPKPMYCSFTPQFRPLFLGLMPVKYSFSRLCSFTATPYPLQYEMIISRPNNHLPNKTHRRLPNHPKSVSNDSEPVEDLGFDARVDEKLSHNDANKNGRAPIEKAKRKYFEKRRKRMYGVSDSDCEDNHRKNESDYVEVKQEVLELRSLHKREEELYFYDAFAYPWEKNKHYKMVYQLEKKHFPGQGFDKAFLEPGESTVRKGKINVTDMVVEEAGEADRGVMFFEENVREAKDVKVEDYTERKVENFFKCLKKFPTENDKEVVHPEPFLSTRSVGLPPRWDDPNGSVVLVNKPKGWTSFTVCGKLRRLVQVKKVGHAGTLDPMATGLLIVCIGKATKLVDRYQGMIKGYSGIFRLGEATSTLDADSQVIQREPWEHIKDNNMKKCATSFCGEIWQVPPMFSAIKVGGERMYEKARKGESIELSPRRVSILEFVVERSLEDRQNIVFRVTCSKGTYIRSLCSDFGKALGSCAHLTSLRRDSIGEYSADDAWEFQELEDAITKGYL